MEETKTTIVNVNQKSLRKQNYTTFDEWLKVPNHVYIGRGNSRANRKASKWANPFKVEKYGREGCIESGLIDDIDELDGKVLGCWCKPKSCHGDVLIRVLNTRVNDK